jgi:photosystem II stability/assembly factor-like uncharacterized protein
MNNNTHIIHNSNWTYTGSWRGGTVTEVLLVPGTEQRIVASSRAGIYCSDDAGGTWQRGNQGLDDPAVLALAATVDSRGRAVLFAGTETGRLYRSLDAGQTWQELSGWAGLGVATALAISPAFAQDQTLFVATADGPFRSQDGGVTWESAIFGLVDLEVLCFAFAPDFAESETLWLGTANGGIYRSRNGGRSWRDAGAGLPDTAMQCLATVAREGATLLSVGTEEHGIFLSEDGGNSWRPLETISQVSVNCLAVSADGERWLAGTEDGIILSTNGGEQWQAASDDEVIALSLVWAGDDLALAASWQNGLYRSQDGGRSWQRANGSGSESLAAHAPPLALLTPTGELFAADLDGEWVHSTNEGSTWKPVALPFEEPVQVMAGSGLDETFVLCAGSGATLYQRHGKGEWQERPLPEPVRLLALSPEYTEDGVLFFVGVADHLYRSTDSGANWQLLPLPWGDRQILGMAIPAGYTKDASLHAITVYAGDAGYQMELWQSSDGGESWRDLAALTTESPVVALLPLADEEQSIFLAVQNRLIHIYTKTGDGEMAVDQQFLEAGVRITALAASQGILYAASNRGVWQRAEDGALYAVGNGLDSEIVVALLPAADGKLCSMTLGGHVWWSGR